MILAWTARRDLGADRVRGPSGLFGPGAGACAAVPRGPRRAAPEPVADTPGAATRRASRDAVAAALQQNFSMLDAADSRDDLPLHESVAAGPVLSPSSSRATASPTTAPRWASRRARSSPGPGAPSPRPPPSAPPPRRPTPLPRDQRPPPRCSPSRSCAASGPTPPTYDLRNSGAAARRQERVVRAHPAAGRHRVATRLLPGRAPAPAPRRGPPEPEAQREPARRPRRRGWRSAW